MATLLAADSAHAVPETPTQATEPTLASLYDGSDLAPETAATRWGYQFDMSPNALGGDPIALRNPGDSYRTLGFSIQADYSPPINERYGKLSFGPNLGLYSIPARAGVSSGTFANWQLGAQVRYQFRYFERQWVVPTAALLLERMRYDFTFETLEHYVWLTGFSAGLWVYLNNFDAYSSNSLRNNSGLLRCYLVAELRALSGESADLAIGGSSYFFGLRFEH